MGATAQWNLPYPDPPDPADVPADMRELADAVAAGFTGFDNRLDALEASVGAFVVVADQRLAADAASIDFQNIPQTYAALKLVVVARGAGANGDIQLQFNGAITGYDRQRLSASAGAATAAEGINAAAIPLGSCPGSAANANLFTAIEAIIPDYASAVHQQSVVSYVFRKLTVQTGDFLVGVYGGGWRSTVAVNRITLTHTNGNLVAGSRATLYGMRGLVA